MKPLFSNPMARILQSALVFLACQSQLHAASFELPLNLDGNQYIAVLNPNDALMTQVGDDNPADNESDQHYLGELTDVENSWVRVSNIADEWHGVASAFDQLFVIDSTAITNQALRAKNDDSALLFARPINRFDHEAATCAADVHNKGQHQSSNALLSSSEVVSALTLPRASELQQRSFSQLCTNKVSYGNGGELCLIAELELAFDQEFQTAIGNTASAVATSIMNVVDGIYRNNFNISFETLSRTMLTNANDVFTNSTSAGALLNDVRDKKDADAIPFVTNPNALFHLVTGRNFDGSTVGVAYVDVLCGKKYATGTSQLLGSGNGRVALTAAVIAHELGHNFGSGHDGQVNACAVGHIMWPSVNPNTQTFSTCSKTAITTAIGNIENNNSKAALNACFNYPVDLGVVAGGGNPSSVTKNQIFSTAFTLTPKQAAENIASATFSGTVSGGTIESVSLPGQTCTVASNKLSLNCNLSNFTIAANAAIEMKASADQLTLSLNTNIGGAQLRDIVSSNKMHYQYRFRPVVVAVVIPRPMLSASPIERVSPRANRLFQIRSP